MKSVLKKVSQRQDDTNQIEVNNLIFFVCNFETSNKCHRNNIIYSNEITNGFPSYHQFIKKKYYNNNNDFNSSIPYQ